MGFYDGALPHFNFIIYYDTYFPKAQRGVILVPQWNTNYISNNNSLIPKLVDWE